MSRKIVRTHRQVRAKKRTGRQWIRRLRGRKQTDHSKLLSQREGLMSRELKLSVVARTLYSHPLVGANRIGLARFPCFSFRTLGLGSLLRCARFRFEGVLLLLLAFASGVQVL